MAAAFGADWIGEHDKKFYVWADDGGERVQIAFALTCPKANVESAVRPRANVGLDFTVEDPVVEISEEEKNNIQELMKKLGL